MSKDKVKATAKAHTRYHLANGDTVPGSTTVCGLLNKPQLVIWANKLGLEGIDSTKYTDKAATIGTLIHYMVECHIKGEEEDLTEYSEAEIDQAKNGFIKFLEWEESHQVKYIASEVPMVSEKHKFGGTIDCIAMVDGVEEIIDFKSGKGIYNEHYLQVSSYKEMATENGHNPQRIRILNIGRTEDENFKEEVIDANSCSKYFNIFTNLLNIYYVKKELKWY